MKPKCILTDLGSTLVYNNDPLLYREALARMGTAIDPIVMDLAFHNADKHFMRYMPGLFMKKTAVYREIYLGVVNYNLGIDMDLVDCSRHYQEMTEQYGFRWQLFDGVLETIAGLKRQNIQITLVSNWDNTCRQVLKDVGLLDYLDEIIISDEVGYEKPSKEIFEIAMNRSAVQPSECLFIGDNYYDDGAGSEKLGIPYVIINPYGRKGIEELSCDIIAEFPQLLEWLNRPEAA